MQRNIHTDLSFLKILLSFLSLTLLNLSCNTNIQETHSSDSLSRNDSSQSSFTDTRIIKADTGLEDKSPINLKQLEYLNQGSEFPFFSEDSIIGIGIVSSDWPFSIYDKKGNVLISIELNDSSVAIYVGKDKIKYHDTLISFRPRLFSPNPDYYRLALDCIKKDSNYYEVIINRQTRQTGFIRNNPSINFETIEAYVENWTGLGFDFDRANNPLRRSPSLQSDTIHNELENKYSIWNGENIEMKGDWMKIRISKNETGWIRWRKGNQILIRLYYYC